MFQVLANSMYMVQAALFPSYCIRGSWVEVRAASIRKKVFIQNMQITELIEYLNVANITIVETGVIFNEESL